MFKKMYVHCHTIPNSQEREVTQVPTDRGWIKMWYLHTVECYSAVKKEISPCGTTWMDLEGTMLSDINQTKINTV